MTFLRKLIHVPRFYPAEYILMLASSLVLLVAAASLASMLIAYALQHSTPGILADLNVLFVLSVLIVVLPVHLVVYARVMRTDRSTLTALSLRTASAATAIYVFVAAAAAVVLTVWLVLLWLSAIMGIGAFDKTLATHTLSLLAAIGLLKCGALHFLRARAGAGRPVLYLATAGVVGLALIVLGFAYPAREYRDAARDFIKENDLAQIQQAVSNYVNEHDALPDSLQHLHELQPATADRLGDYTYTPHGDTVLGMFGYELCATFAASGHTFGFPPHQAGEQCHGHIAISASLMEQGLVRYVEGVEDGIDKLTQEIAGFLQGVGTSLSQQTSELERYLGSVVDSTANLQQEMQRLEGHMGNLESDTSQMDRDFAAVGQFIHDLLCGLDPECSS